MFERAGPIIDPQYHRSTCWRCLSMGPDGTSGLDLSERVNYDFNQLHTITKVTVSRVEAT